MKNKEKLTRLLECAMLIAIEVVLARFCSIQTPITRIGFDFAPMALAGILYGPWWALAVGALADFIGAHLFPIGPYFAGFTIVAGLSGMTYGLLLYRKGNSLYSGRARVVRTLIAVPLVTLVMQLGLDTVNLMILMDKGFMALLPTRVAKAAVMTPVQLAVIPLLFRVAQQHQNRLLRS